MSCGRRAEPQVAQDSILEANVADVGKDATEAAFLGRLQRIEEHIRNNNLRVSIASRIGDAARQKEDISNINEAKKLAFYIFWNVKASHDACAACLAQCSTRRQAQLPK